MKQHKISIGILARSSIRAILWLHKTS